jgi:hypothetical protein
MYIVDIYVSKKIVSSIETPALSEDEAKQIAYSAITFKVTKSPKRDAA